MRQLLKYKTYVLSHIIEVFTVCLVFQVYLAI